MPCQGVDELLAVYDDIAAGELARARRRLRAAKQAGADPDAVAELEAFMAAPPGGLARGPAVDADLTHPGQVAPPRRDAIPFRCIACRCEEHYVRRVLLVRRWASLPAWESIDRSARIYGCAGCGHIAWFGPAAPGAFQHEAPRGDPVCRCCGHGTLHRSAAPFNRRGMAAIGLGALSKRACIDTCRRCGLVHWAAGGTPWQRPAPAGDGCLACGGQAFTRWPVVANARVVDALGLDWVGGVDCLECRACHALRWQARYGSTV